MKPVFNVLASAIATALTFGALSACTQQNSNLHITSGNMALVMKPTDTSTELAQLQRYRGQTSFLERQAYWPRRGGPMPAPGAPPTGGAPGRAQQESDVFKVGVAGSKLLYLMNHYRGLQVVSFANGPESAELLGRAPTVGDSVDQMYSDLTRNRLISIEHVYFGEKSHSLLGVYDVADSHKPTLQRKIDIDGMVEDSRIVGDVLYVASREGETGYVTSFALTTPDLHQVEQTKMSLPVATGENMNILDMGDGHYYLIAVLQKATWGWWNDASTIDVVDISDAKGKIKPLMSVATKGFVRERSQTVIRNNTLVVTSNYDPNPPAKTDPSQPIQWPTRQPVLRIAVETFKFPTATSETLSDDEAEFRRLNIQRQLQNLSGSDYQQKYDQLMNDPVLGLRGRFVRSGETLKKIVDDSIITVGDGSGLSAQLQDVRYQDGLLYAFWVPRDQIDPFDIFDMSAPENGIKYVGRLHFDGWIERAIPMNFGTKHYVLGLGWILPVVNNDDGRRVPQAMLFEINNMKATPVAQLSLEGKNVWTDFNGADKMVEVRETADGKGEILFGAERFAKNDYDGGGQIVRYDLSNTSLTEGPFLSGGAEWVRRVFTNPEIDRVNAFSDHALATFSSPQAAGDMHPVNILELARNIEAFEKLGNNGVQIVTDGSWSSQDSTTDLRQVALDNIDAEKAQTKRLTLKGSYAAHAMLGGDLYVLTYVTGGMTLTHIDPAFTVKQQQTWTDDSTDRKVSLDGQILITSESQMLIQAGTKILKVDSSLKSSELTLDATCPARENDRLQLINGKIYIASSEQFDSKDFANENFIRNFFAPAELQQANIVCHGDFNIPGTVRSIDARGNLLVEDNWISDMKDTQNAVYQNSLLSLTLVGTNAVLKDESSLDGSGRGGFMPCPGCRSMNGRLQAVGTDLVSLTSHAAQGQLDLYRLDQDAMIVKDSRLFSVDFADVLKDSGPLGYDETASVVGIKQAGDSFVAVLKFENVVQAIKWTAADIRPQAVSDVVPLPGWGGEIHYEAGAGTLEIAQGWYGLTQLKLKK